MSGNRKSYVTGTFRLSREHIDLSRIAGYSQYELIDQYLEVLEVDLHVKPNTLLVYYAENRGTYQQYWYTEESNTSLIISFEVRLYSFNSNIDPITN